MILLHLIAIVAALIACTSLVTRAQDGTPAADLVPFTRLERRPDHSLFAPRQEKREAVAMVLAAFDGLGWDEPGCAQGWYRRVANGLLAVLQIGPDGEPRSAEPLG